MSKITPEARKRMAAHTLQDQLIAKVDHLLRERRLRNEPVAAERRGRNPQRKGYEEWSDVTTAFAADAHRRQDNGPQAD